MKLRAYRKKRDKKRDDIGVCKSHRVDTR